MLSWWSEPIVEKRPPRKAFVGCILWVTGTGNLLGFKTDRTGHNVSPLANLFKWIPTPSRFRCQPILLIIVSMIWNWKLFKEWVLWRFNLVEGLSTPVSVFRQNDFSPLPLVLVIQLLHTSTLFCRKSFSSLKNIATWPRRLLTALKKWCSG